MRASAQRRSRKMYKRLVKRENAESGMSANSGNNKGAYMNSVISRGPSVFQSTQLWLLLPGRRRLHRRERGCECTERGLLVLHRVSSSACIRRSFEVSRHLNIRLLKLVTGVEISTRPVRRSGKEGNPRKRNNRSAEAAPNNAVFRRSMTIVRIERRVTGTALTLSPNECPFP